MRQHLAKPAAPSAAELRTLRIDPDNFCQLDPSGRAFVEGHERDGSPATAARTGAGEHEPAPAPIERLQALGPAQVQLAASFRLPDCLYFATLG